LNKEDKQWMSGQFRSVVEWPKASLNKEDVADLNPSGVPGFCGSG